jgi:hypothetical protein
LLKCLITLDFNFRGFAWWTMKSTRISNPRIIPTFTVYDATQMHVVVYLWVRILVGLSKINKGKIPENWSSSPGFGVLRVTHFYFFIFFYVD